MALFAVEAGRDDDSHRDGDQHHGFDRESRRGERNEREEQDPDKIEVRFVRAGPHGVDLLGESDQ